MAPSDMFEVIWSGTVKGRGEERERCAGTNGNARGAAGASPSGWEASGFAVTRPGTTTGISTDEYTDSAISGKELVQ